MAVGKKRGLTFQELSKLTGLSASFLSRVERSLTTPSIAFLHRNCSALEIPISRAQLSVVRRAAEQIYIRLDGSSASHRHLSGTFPGWTLEALINEFPPGYQHPLVPHEGEEFGYVLEGELNLVVGEEEHPHSYSTDQGAEVLIVSTQESLETQTAIRRSREWKKGRCSR